jgi:hypothetical protein
MALEPYRQHRQYRNDLNLVEYWGTAAPSAATDTGPYKIGDIVWNTAPAAGGASYLGWICTTAGADGSTSTWKGYGLLQT